MKSYDLIVLGSGGAGYQVAEKAKNAGWSVAVINDGPAGGTCPVRGCIPKKVLSGTAEIVDTVRRLHALDILENEANVNWQKLIEFKKTFTDPVPKSTIEGLKELEIDVYEGQAKFTDNLTLEIGDETLQAKKVHVAVGMVPAKLPFPGAEHLAISDDFLELENLPESIVFVGGGYISFELAHIAARCGAKNVTILHGDEQPLRAFDPDVIKKLIAASEDAGIDVVLGAKVKAIEKDGEKYQVSVENGKTYEAKLAVHGAGRVPNIAALNLDASNIDFDEKRGISVDQHLRSSSNPDVFAAGDCADAGPALSPVAGVQGGIVAENILSGAKTQPSYDSTPSVIFATPPACKVGLLETEARSQNLKFDVIENDTSEWFDAARLNQKFSYSKILIEKDSEKILGAHIIGNHAEDLINIFSLAIDARLTKSQLTSPIFAFPSSSDDLRSML